MPVVAVGGRAGRRRRRVHDLTVPVGVTRESGTWSGNGLSGVVVGTPAPNAARGGGGRHLTGAAVLDLIHDASSEFAAAP